MTSRSLTSFVLASWVLVGGFAPVSPALGAERMTERQVRERAAAIDAIVKTHWDAKGVKPTLPTGDTEFMRRAYLGIVGRVPTLAEARAFLDDPAYNKRQRLVDRLLDSPGYVSHMFNFFADLLRLQSRDRNDVGGHYPAWVKEQVRKNTPFDRMVYAMLTATGPTRDNGAAGYFIRDTGMPLDNASVTAQVFLGTQIGCAQCHDHPFDKWTQREFYEFAAFTASVETRRRPGDFAKEQIAKLPMDKRRAAAEEYRELQKKIDKLPPMESQLLKNLLRASSYAVHDGEKPLKLPDDYKYDDGKPGEKVTPRVLIGEEPKMDSKQSTRESFARWLTSPSNPRFAMTMANRLWARAIGIGLFEPLDDYNDSTVVSHPALLKHLTALMVELKFDLKEFQRVIYTTRVYELSVSPEELSFDQYHLHAGRLRRMTAEQVWDSLMTLAVEDVDAHTAEAPTTGYRNLPMDVDVRGLSSAELLALPAKLIERRKEMEAQARRERMEEMMEMRQAGVSRADAQQLSGGKPEAAKAKKKGSYLFGSQLLRASELPSPAPNGHFLADFGQSRRESPGGGNTEPSVTQALSLLNGRLTALTQSTQTPLALGVKAQATLEGKITALWLSTLGREPRLSEVELAKKEIEVNKSKAFSNLAWALLNSREFMYIQ